MALSDDAIIAMARDANPEHDLTAMLPFLSRFAALVAAREREKCAAECESLSHRSRWVRAGINGAPMETCQYAAAIRARLGGQAMTKDEIIAMARQSGFDTYKNETAGVEGYDCTEELERFAALVAAKEREACAQVCESRVTPGTGSVAILGGAADAIRARGKP